MRLKRERSVRLTISKNVDGKIETRHVEHDGNPTCLYKRTDEHTTGGTISSVFGCHVVWCFYNGGKRVATVTITMGNGEGSLREKNYLRTFWPERVEIDTARTKCKVMLRNADVVLKEPLYIDPYFLNDFFIHPYDDASFNASCYLKSEDRDWIDHCDAEKNLPRGRLSASAIKSEVKAALTEAMTDTKLAMVGKDAGGGPAKSTARRKRTSRKNGSKGGRNTRDDRATVKKAAEDVFREIGKPGFKMLPTCTHYIRGYKLTISREALARHVNKMRNKKP